MSLPDNVSSNMGYIQKLFMDVQHYIPEPVEMQVLFSYLDAEPPEFRSVAYESASMNLALNELNGSRQLENWKEFHKLSAGKHGFHNEIGLGWAFAKAAIDPRPYFQTLPPVRIAMVYDGIGYYHALFNGRKTIKSQLIPGSFDDLDHDGFDQGLGRRLWYTSNGDPELLKKYLEPFIPARKPALWKGIGIACGYVGGCEGNVLEKLNSDSSTYKDQLSSGIKLALISRQASGSINPSIELACQVVCEQTVHSILMKSMVVINPTLPIT